jgi:hypothetical protein
VEGKVKNMEEYLMKDVSKHTQSTGKCEGRNYKDLEAATQSLQTRNKRWYMAELLSELKT